VSDDGTLALFLMLGQTANKQSLEHPSVVDGKPLMISENYDLASSLPDSVRNANHAVEGYRLFFVFETYLKDFVIQTLSKDGKDQWWDKVPKDVQDEITKLEDTEEIKSWMALGSRDKSALLTYPQLLRVIDVCWKKYFQDIIRDKALVQEARLISHLRNTLCHMTCISDEETDRIKMVIRDWFRVVSP
jgi:HEPN superfamily Swt1-like protein